MDTYLIEGHNIESYLPKNSSHQTKEYIRNIAQEIVTRIEQNLSMGFRYNGVARLVIPASLYLQEQTIAATSSITKGAKRIPLSPREGARRTMAVDAIEVARQSGSTGGWKSFHLDQIDDLQILDEEELSHLFPKIEQARIDSLIHAQFPKKGGFVRNWNYWFRTPIIEAASNQDLLK